MSVCVFHMTIVVWWCISEVADSSLLWALYFSHGFIHIDSSVCSGYYKMTSYIINVWPLYQIVVCYRLVCVIFLIIHCQVIPWQKLTPGVQVLDISNMLVHKRGERPLLLSTSLVQNLCSTDTPLDIMRSISHFLSPLRIHSRSCTENILPLLLITTQTNGMLRGGKWSERDGW